MIAKIIEFYQEYKSLFSAVLPIVTYLIGLFSGKLIKRYRAYTLNRILSLKKSPLEIIMPIRYGNVSPAIEKTSPLEGYITYTESKVFVEMNKIFETLVNKNKRETYPILYSSDQSIPKQTNNAFIIGGIFANTYVQNIFLDKFKNISFSCSRNTFLNHANISPILEEISPDNISKRRICINDDELFSYHRDNEGYVVLIKLTGKTDFLNSDHGTLHICFGNTSETTLASIQCFHNFQRELYKRLKKRKKHYFVIIKCKNGCELDFRNFYDLTDKMF